MRRFTNPNAPAGKHRHKCDKCGFVWQHSDECPGRDFEASHTCPCGGVQQWKYYGDDKPGYVGDLRPIRLGIPRGRSIVRAIETLVETVLRCINRR